MNDQTIEKVFPTKPTRSRAETKADLTDAAARTIIETEEAARLAKTERLRRARMAHEKTNPSPEPEKRRIAAARKIKRVNCN